jgi:hypothetical protein
MNSRNVEEVSMLGIGWMGSWESNRPMTLDWAGICGWKVLEMAALKILEAEFVFW